MKRSFVGIRAGLVALLIIASSSLVIAAPRDFFEILVVDEQTGRGVPLVELRTVNDIRYYTDSNGLIAFDEPGLMDREVFFHVFSHGYEFPADGFGNRGRRLRTKAGGKAKIEIRRVNIAERLYRVTGQGIYRDSVLLGRKTPLGKPVLDGRVLGQDTVFTAVYRDQIYWFWGDTMRESYPLGNFATSGATSELPGKGGLSPSVGVNLKYFEDDEGFSRRMAPLPGEGLVWVDALTTLKDPGGRERILTRYSRMKSLSERLEHGLAVFNDAKQTFEPLVKFDLNAPASPAGQCFKARDGEKDYLYFAQPYPVVRVEADWNRVTNLNAYEVFTCVGSAASSKTENTPVLRDASNHVCWAWRSGGAPMTEKRQRELIRSGQLDAADAWIDLRDAESGKSVTPNAVSVHWNNFRKCYVMIGQEIGGTASFCGEIWYSEASRPEGPWQWARKIVTHRQYTFYNPCHHPFFDEKGGRIIYFEGTYTDEFSGAKEKTPRYNYNQIMYRLDLADPRLRLPKAR